jgi:hypothetical protein
MSTHYYRAPGLCCRCLPGLLTAPIGQPRPAAGEAGLGCGIPQFGTVRGGMGRDAGQRCGCG